VDVTTEHACAGRLENELREAGHRIATIDYANDVHMTLHLPTESSARFEHWLAERTSGRAAVRFGPELFIDVPDT
jgi:putative IMPACT (imprinted ancient) family translation regulator